MLIGRDSKPQKAPASPPSFSSLTTITHRSSQHCTLPLAGSHPLTSCYSNHPPNTHSPTHQQAIDLNMRLALIAAPVLLASNVMGSGISESRGRGLLLYL